MEHDRIWCELVRSQCGSTFWKADADGRMAPNVEGQYVYTGQQASGENAQLLAVIHPDDRERVARTWLKSLATKSPYEVEYRVFGGDRYRVFTVRGIPLLDSVGALREWVGICTDITERRQLEERLRESEQRFRSLFELAAAGMAQVGLSGQWLLINQKLCDIVGYTHEELLGRTFQHITYPADLERDLVQMRRLLEGEIQTYSLEKRYIRKDGSLVWINLTVSLVRDSSGKPAYFVSVIEDISERKQVEEERQRLYESEQRVRAEATTRAQQLEAIINTMADGVYVCDETGRIVQMNAVAGELFASDPQFDYFPPSPQRSRLLRLHDSSGQPLAYESLPINRILRGEVFKGAAAADIIIRTLDGHEIELSLSGAPLRDPDGQIVGGILITRDVTERRRLERRTHAALQGLLEMAEALVRLPESAEEVEVVGRRLVELTRSVLDCQRVSIHLVDPETGILRPLAVVGLSRDLEETWWEEEQQENRLSDTLIPRVEERLCSGEVLTLDMTQPPYDALPNLYDIRIVLIAGMCMADCLIGILTLDYGSVSHVYTPEEVALASAVAKLSALVLQRQHLLLEQARSQGRELALREANQRMEEFLGIASHELRTPLTTIKANVQLALRRLSATIQEPEALTAGSAGRINAARDMLERADRQVSVLNRLVGDMIDISRIRTGKMQVYLRPEPCDLVSIVRKAVREQRKVAPKRSIVMTKLPDEIVPVIADPDRIAQVLNNYLTNALKYSAADKPVEVRLEIENQIAHVSVRDEGPGLPIEEQAHIWKSFYQAPGVRVLSGSGIGLGLGLHISQMIIKRHQGQTGVHSAPGEGSTFWFTLPLAHKSDASTQQDEIS
jgi:PAS domain S-box-containing protein